jgi:hypothetical protein
VGFELADGGGVVSHAWVILVMSLGLC